MRFLLVCAAFSALAAGRTVEFNRDVRPILSDKCFTCHGPDAAAKKIPIRLDSEAAMQKAAAKIPGRIAADKPAMLMPPPYSGLKLNPSEIETMRLWVEQGAKWQGHWSFLAPRRAEVPAGVHPIDYFIRQRLEREGLKPSPPADRATLLRRVSFDLTGLPPAPAELDAFLNDRSPAAYEKAVDRLLGSPRYGERMAARWLDAARYADSNGYQYDGERFMWRWRDWVIEAFNRNMPFNQFALEQIAGDMLPHATLEQKIATGFNRNHRANTEDGIIPEEYAVEYVVDRVETTSTVFLGLTLGCARCHNHKYDPFTQKEFYQVFAYFNNVPELGRAMKYGNSPPLIPAPTREQQQQLGELLARMHAVEGRLAANRGQAQWEAHAPAQYWAPPSLPLEGEGAPAFDIEDRFSLSAWVYPEVEADGPVVTRMLENPKGKGVGLHLNHGKAHVHLTSVYADDGIRVDTEETVEPGRWHHLAMTYSGSRMAEGVHIYIDGKLAKLKASNDTLYRPFGNAGKKFVQPWRIGAGWGKDRPFRGRIERVHVYGRVLDAQEIAALSTNETLAAIAAKPSRSETESDILRHAFLEASAPDDVKQLAAFHDEKEKLERSFPTVMIMAERPERRETHMLVRGAYDKPGEKVEPGVPAVLPPLPEGVPNNRLGFAKWVVDPANPLTARVTVNRFWQMYFGTGLIKTTEDFGSQGEWPSNPELLDWLATEFIRTAWDVKAMQKLIVTSETYKQSSKASPELIQRDPDNRLLARGPRFRLSAENIRDQALFVSGLLAEKLGGPSVKPYQPEGLWKELAMQDMDYVQSHGPDLYRRSLYTFWKRTIAPPMMVNFDASMRESCVVRETRTDTPLQALNLMNDVTFVEAARLLGQRMMKEGGADPAARLRYGFRLVTSRFPSETELQLLRDNLQYHLDYFSGKPGETKQFLSEGDSPADPGLDQRQLAAYASVGSLMLNLDEAVTKQ